jgi:hypothetical protein
MGTPAIVRLLEPEVVESDRLDIDPLVVPPDIQPLLKVQHPIQLEALSGTLC